MDFGQKLYPPLEESFVPTVTVTAQSRNKTKKTVCGAITWSAWNFRFSLPKNAYKLCVYVKQKKAGHTYGCTSVRQFQNSYLSSGGGREATGRGTMSSSSSSAFHLLLLLLAAVPPALAQDDDDDPFFCQPFYTESEILYPCGYEVRRGNKRGLRNKQEKAKFDDLRGGFSKDCLSFKRL